jgi:hypothetical protein
MTTDIDIKASLQTPVAKTVDRLQSAMMALPQVDCPLIHRFTPGMYSREIFNPKGVLIVTKVWKVEHQFALIKGKLSVMAEDGTVAHIQAPHVGITKIGTRRVIFAHEDSVFVTFHANPTDETSIEKLEESLLFPHEVSPGLEFKAEMLKLMEGKL